eukprot:scaffold417489_cov49-Prasinocladus_malaysianus.AAC.1
MPWSPYLEGLDGRRGGRGRGRPARARRAVHHQPLLGPSEARLTGPHQCAGAVREGVQRVPGVQQHPRRHGQAVLGEVVTGKPMHFLGASSRGRVLFVEDRPDRLGQPGTSLACQRPLHTARGQINRPNKLATVKPIRTNAGNTNQCNMERNRKTSRIHGQFTANCYPKA